MRGRFLLPIKMLNTEPTRLVRLGRVTSVVEESHLFDTFRQFTMSGQRIQFLTREGVKTTDIFHRLTAQFGNQILSKTLVISGNDDVKRPSELYKVN